LRHGPPHALQLISERSEDVNAVCIPFIPAKNKRTFSISQNETILIKAENYLLIL
jgi:hypothetical protein